MGSGVIQLVIFAERDEMLGGGGEKFVLVVDDPVPAAQVQLRHPEGGDDPSLQRTPEHAPGKHRDAQLVQRGIDKGGGAAGFPGGLDRKAGGQCGGIKGFPGGAALFPQKEGLTPQLLQCHGLAGGEGPPRSTDQQQCVLQIGLGDQLMGVHAAFDEGKVQFIVQKTLLQRFTRADAHLYTGLGPQVLEGIHLTGKELGADGYGGPHPQRAHIVAAQKALFHPVHLLKQLPGLLLQALPGGVDWVATVLFAAAFAAMRWKKPNPIGVMVCCGAAGLVCYSLMRGIAGWSI